MWFERYIASCTFKPCYGLLLLSLWWNWCSLFPFWLDEFTYQQYIGCAFNFQGPIGHFWRYGYNSKDIMHVDLGKEAVVSTSDEGSFMAKERQGKDYFIGKEIRLKKICSAVQTVFSQSNNSLSRAGRPEITDNCFWLSTDRWQLSILRISLSFKTSLCVPLQLNPPLECLWERWRDRSISCALCRVSTPTPFVCAGFMEDKLCTLAPQPPAFCLTEMEHSRWPVI